MLLWWHICEYGSTGTNTRDVAVVYELLIINMVEHRTAIAEIENGIKNNGFTSCNFKFAYQ